MGGDHMGGLAVAIFVVMLLMLIGGFLVAFLIGRWIAGRRGMSGGRRALVGLAVGIVGLGAGALAVTATFFESTWSPPPSLALTVPPGFAHKSVILLEDPRAPTALVWRGVEGPFMGISTSLGVPANGIVRVKAFGPLAGRGDLSVTWSDGALPSGSGGGPPPPGLGATGYIALWRGQWQPGDDLPLDAQAFAALVRAREVGR